MLKVSTPKRRPRAWLWILMAVASLAIHGGLYAASSKIKREPPAPTGTSQVDFMVQPPPPKPESKPEPEVKPDPKPEPEPEVTPEPPKPDPKPKPKPKKKRRPKPNKKAKPQPKNEPPPKPVFGATKESVGDLPSSVSVRVGNNLESDMDLEAVDPSKVKDLPPGPADLDAEVGEEPPPPPPPPKKKAIKPVPAFELTEAPTFSKRVEPVYPEEARAKGIEGIVSLEVWLDEEGKSKKIRVLDHPGFGLDKAAIRALASSTFEPGKIKGKAVPTKLKIPYKFVLNS